MPAGNPDGGQWTGNGGGSSSSASGSELTQVAQNASFDQPPEVPPERPSSPRARNAVIKQVAKYVANDEDALLTSLIAAARMFVERTLSLTLVTESWSLYVDGWPRSGTIRAADPAGAGGDGGTTPATRRPW